MQRLLILRGQQRPVDLDAVGDLDVSARALGRKPHRVETRPEIDVVHLRPFARLAVAEIPRDLRLERQVRRRGVLEEDADQRLGLVGQRHVAGNLESEVGQRLGALGHRRADRCQAHRARAKHLAGNRRRRGLLRRGRDFPGRHHHRLGSGGHVEVLELVRPGRKLDVFAAAGLGLMHDPLARDDLLAVDQQKTGVPTGSQEPVGARGWDVQRSAVAAEERLRLRRERIARVVDGVDIAGADRLGLVERLAQVLGRVEQTILVLARLQQQAVLCGPRRHGAAEGGLPP